jgi:hypothetical protein
MACEQAAQLPSLQSLKSDSAHVLVHAQSQPNLTVEPNHRQAITEIAYLKRAQLPVTSVRVPVRVAEFYFDLVTPQGEADVMVGRCLQEAAPGWLAYRCSTRIIDLTQAPKVLFSMCAKNNRYKIERARRGDGVEIDFTVAPAEDRVSEFIRYYDAFADTKDVAPVQRAQFDAITRSGKLVIAAARDSAGAILAARAYVLGQTRARLMYSASLFRLQAESSARNRIGRANRLLHWEDIIRFRDLGVLSYDMGGWYTGHGNQALLRINSFKQEFGGKVVEEWDVFRPRSARGWLYVRGRDLLHRRRRR